jgi:mycofactocin system glycosyltransferase
VELDPATRRLDVDLWFGGSPARVLRLTRAGRAAWARLRGAPVSDEATGRLARRLTDAGIAHPRPPRSFRPADITVVIPVRDRSDRLERCLHELRGRYPVVVVDDASLDPDAVGAVADRYGAKLVHRSENGGPGAARNTGLEQVAGDYVAFVDSDCVPPRGGWLHTLSAHFADPLVAAVAPRITAEPAAGWAGRYGAAESSLDLGDQPARVRPGARVGYVPTAVLLARVAALRDIAADGEVFDERLRVGEDVDVVWRLHRAGWRIRYDPSEQVGHADPPDWAGLLRRRFSYGTSAAPLAKRHGDVVAPLAVHPWPMLTVLAVLARRPTLATAAFAASVLTTRRSLEAAGVPPTGVVKAMAAAAYQTWLGLGRYAAQLMAPLLVLGLLRRRWRAATAALALGPPLVAWLQHGPPLWRRLDPVRFVLGWFADQLGYGAGVWTGALRHRSAVPLVPVLVRRPVRIDTTAAARKGPA